MKLLIDADIYAYRSVSATEEEIDWGDDVWSLTTDIKAAKRIFREELRKISEACGSDNMLLCFSSRSNFRKDINPSYKSGRKKTRKPLGYASLIAYLKEVLPSVEREGLEADDVLGILATQPENKGKCIVVSDDKDLKTIPCKLYRPHADERLEISEQDADRWFYTQTLTGDSTDGYGGCPRIGAKRAETILGPRPVWSTVERAYLAQGMTRDDAIMQARMARILRWSDWNHTDHKPILWEPAA
tara:strand:+ start:7849 stop:8580 length:732 start_codon:yes stop_codon:yes gene_type:complete